MIKVNEELNKLYIKNGEDVDASVANRALQKLVNILDESSLLDESLYTGRAVSISDIEPGTSIGDLVFFNASNKWETFDISQPLTEEIALYTEIENSLVIVFNGTVYYNSVVKGETYYPSVTDAGKLQTTSYDGAIKVGIALDTNIIRLLGRGSDTINGIKSGSFIRNDIDNTILENLEIKKSVYQLDTRSIYMPKINANTLSIRDTANQGYIKIKMPLLWNSTSLRFTVNVYDNVTVNGESNSFTMTIGARNDNSTNAWDNAFAICSGNNGDTFHDVNFGSDATNSYIYIGSNSTVWNRTVVNVQDLLASSDNDLMPWSNAWEITYEPTLGIIEKTITSGLVASMANDTKLFGGSPASDFIRSASNNSPITVGSNAEGTESYNQQQSALYGGESRINASWIYTPHIEAINERDNASTGLAIGEDGVFNKAVDGQTSDLTFYTNGTEKVRIAKDGTVTSQGDFNALGALGAGSIAMTSDDGIISSNASANSRLGLYDALNAQDVFIWNSIEQKITSLPTVGTIEIGSTAKASDNIIDMMVGNGNKNLINMTSNGSGSAEVYLGSSQDFGSGILYNGDDNPDDIGQGLDTIFYANNNGTKTAMIEWNALNTFVTFNEPPKVQGVDVALVDHTHPPQDIGTLGGLTSAQFLRSDIQDTATASLSVGDLGRGLNVASGDASVQSVAQSQSTYNNQPFLNAPWIYANVIEASNERGAFSTGMAIGNDGKWNQDDQNITIFSAGTKVIGIDENLLTSFETPVKTLSTLTLGLGAIAEENIVFNDRYIATNGTGTGTVGIIDGFTNDEVLVYDEADTTLHIADVEGSATVGSLVKQKDNIFRMQTSSDYKNILEMTTAGQGSSEVYIGQNTAYGMGVLYNGSDIPDDLKEADWTVFFSNSNNIRTPMFGWHHSNNYVTFEETPQVDGIKVSLEGHTHEYGGGLDAATLGGEDKDFFLSTLGTASNSSSLGGIIASEYALLTSTVADSTKLNGLEASDYLLTATALTDYVTNAVAYDDIGDSLVDAKGFLKLNKNVYEVDGNGDYVLDGNGRANILDIESQKVQSKIVIEDNTDLTMLGSVNEPSLHIKHWKNAGASYGLVIEGDGEGKLDAEVDKSFEIRTSTNGQDYPVFTNGTAYVVNDVVRDSADGVDSLYIVTVGGVADGTQISENTINGFTLYNGDVKFTVYGDGEVYAKSNMILGDALTVEANGVDVTGDSVFTGNTSFNGNTTNTGTMTIGGITTINAATNIVGAVSVTGTIDATGDITANSDESLKEDIVLIDDAMNKISQLKGVTFTRNDLEDTVTRHTGVIAQDVEKVLPEAVSVNESNGKLAVAYGNMIGLLIEGMKEQQNTIDALKIRLDDLEK